MSRIDTTSSAEMYLRGASLGTQQFGILANLAQQRIDNERQATVDALNVKQLDITNARNARNDVVDTWQTLHGMRISDANLRIAQAQERRRVEEEARAQQQRALEREGRARLASTLGDAVLSELGDTYTAQQEAFTERLLLEQGLVGGGVSAGGSGAAMAAGLSSGNRVEKPVAGVHGSLNAGGLAGRTAAGDGRHAVLGGGGGGGVGGGKVSDHFRVNPRLDPMDQRFVDAVNYAKLTGNVEMMQVLAKLGTDKVERAKTMQRWNLIAQKFHGAGPQILADPTERLGMEVALVLQDKGLLFHVLKSGKLDDLNNVSDEDLRTSLRISSGDNLSEDELDAMVTQLRIVGKAGAEAVYNRANARQGEGRVAVEAIDRKIRGVERDIQAADRNYAALLGNQYATKDDIEKAKAAAEKGRKDLADLYRERDEAAGLPVDEQPKDKVTINIDGKDVQVDDVARAKELAQEARAQFIRIHQREPDLSKDSPDVKEMAEIHNRVMRGAGAVE